MELLTTIITWAVFGLVIGAIARLLYPGPQPMSLLTTMLLGIAGSFLGGLISWALGYAPEAGAFRGAGWILSIIGALIVVWLSLFISSRKEPGMRRPL